MIDRYKMQIVFTISIIMQISSQEIITHFYKGEVKKTQVKLEEIALRLRT